MAHFPMKDIVFAIMEPLEGIRARRRGLCRTKGRQHRTSRLANDVRENYRRSLCSIHGLAPQPNSGDMKKHCGKLFAKHDQRCEERSRLGPVRSRQRVEDGGHSAK